MAEMVDSTFISQLTSILHQETEEGVQSVTGVEVFKFIKNLLAIQNLVADAEFKVASKKDDAVGEEFNKLKGTLYDVEDALDKWNTAAGKLQIQEADQNSLKPFLGMQVCNFNNSSYLHHYRRVFLRCKIGFKIKSLSKTLGNVINSLNMKQGDRETLERPKNIVDMVDKGNQGKEDNKIEPKVYGRDEEIKEIVGKIDMFCKNQGTSPNSSESTISVILIEGPTGIGKTIFAQRVFNDDTVKTMPFEKRIWVSVSHPLDKLKVAKTILESLRGAKSRLTELETVLNHISQFVEEGKNFLLVLDDMRNEGKESAIYWQDLITSLDSGSKGSVILITTCEDVTDMLKLHNTEKFMLRQLSEDDCLLLLKQNSVIDNQTPDGENFEGIGTEIIRKYCMGLPINVNILRGLLGFKKTIKEWKDVLSMLNKEESVERLPLSLSYYNLPSMLRKCLIHCAIFPKNYEIEKDRLIKLWMAQNYLKVDGREDMEVIGEKYFEHLKMHSFFYDFPENDGDGHIIKFKIHNIVHDFAVSLAEECSVIKIPGSVESEDHYSDKNFQHLMIMYENGVSFPRSLYRQIKLRSLVIETSGHYMIDVNLGKLFDKFTCLRTLDLRNHDNVWYKLINRVPRRIKKLVHLRYFNLSGNKKIEELPETLCELYNLQTLELSRCTNLKKLPQGIGKLVNLRHLVNNETSLTYIPKGIERLTRLRTLSEFIVSDDYHVAEASVLECLKFLTHLQGSLSIMMIGNVKEIFKDGKAELKKKENLLGLRLSFKNYEDTERLNKEGEFKALEYLEPPLSLERLKIVYYEGVTMSTWITSLSKLRKMSLGRCMNLKQLPCLGKLPCLESLTIRGMRSVKTVGNEFLGIENNGTTLSSSTSAFPKLKKLKFQKMKEWEEWNDGISEKTQEIMPCLSSLKIEFCPKLKKLPSYIRAVELKINSCTLLDEAIEIEIEKEGTGTGSLA
ncbi:putative disease resistance protein RGA3 [Pistacia vera]|uniref:putative disease resistance protein RGA3 n=1 Tax=Pistacia vera TaxID=55513 RepID=UPI001262EE3F|nr:putative disease resistance protein RGA3 [Pistacia vera]